MLKIIEINKKTNLWWLHKNPENNFTNEEFQKACKRVAKTAMPLMFESKILIEDILNMVSEEIEKIDLLHFDSWKIR